MNMIRVLLADDHEVIRSGIRRLFELEGDIDVIDEAESGEQAYELYNKLSPDVLLMDMSMPGIGGLEALKRILARDNKAKVVIFSMHENPTFATQALTNGATAYIVKSDRPQEIANAIRLAASGKGHLSAVMANKIALQSMTNFNNPADNLTAREFEVFRLIAEGKTHASIGKTLNIGQKTVSNYQTVLKQKLGIETAVEFVRLAMRCGVIESSF
jgi:two-component system, NarL family, invasion response regulator UvrY